MVQNEVRGVVIGGRWDVLSWWEGWWDVLTWRKGW